MAKETELEIMRTLICGKEEPFLDLYVRSARAFRGRHIVINAPMPFMVTLHVILFLNLNVLMGYGEDAFAYREKGPDLHLPTIEAGWPIRVIASYTGVFPGSFKTGAPFELKMSFLGTEP